jgi:HTH-type transcriptional regulator/antitoxin HipB
MAAIAITTPARIGAAIRGARTRAGLTQNQLAERAGVSRRWLITLEQGQGERAELRKVLDTLDALDLDLTLAPHRRDGELAELLDDL